MADKLTAPLVESLTESPEGKTFPVFDGSTQRATIPQWDNVSANYTIEAVTDNDDGFIVPATAPVTEIGRVGANYHSGNIKSVRLIDRTPLQGARFMPSQSALQRWAKVSQVVLAGDARISFAANVVAGSDNRVIGDQNGLLSRITINGSSVVFVDADGVSASFAHGAASGEHILVTLELSPGFLSCAVNQVQVGTSSIAAGDFTFDALYRNGGVFGVTGGLLADLLVEDLETGDTYAYPNRNDSGNKLKNTGNTGSAFDGVWYQGGSPMTNAAADAARTRLPMISRRYLFDEPGRIKEALGGGADATLINLDESDWQAE